MADNNSKRSTFATDLAEMMAAWSTIEAAARATYLTATAEELFRICSSAMKHTLKLR